MPRILEQKMKLLERKKNKLKFLGMTILKFVVKPKGIGVYFLGLHLKTLKSKLGQIIYNFQDNKDFDTRHYDKEIAEITADIKFPKIRPDNHKIAFLATRLFDMGGHSKCLRDLLCALNGKYEQKLFLTQISALQKDRPNIMSDINKYCTIDGTDFVIIKFHQCVKELAKKISSYSPKALFVYIHPDDIFGAAVLSVLRHKGIQILFFDHASHFPVLGMNFSDFVLNGLPSSEKITHKKRHFLHTKIVGLSSVSKDKTVYYSKADLDELKLNLGIKKGYQVTLSGGSSYKFFDKNNSSKYFKMILRILRKKKKLNHLIMSNITPEQQDIINKIFKNSPNEKQRLIFLPFQTDFDKYFQCTDVFIDSFPVSSALTQIDLMRNKVASVVKINKKQPELSFHEYQMPNYPYMFERVKDMENAIIELLNDPKKRQKIIEKNYKFWLKTYEISATRKRYIKILEGK